MSFPPSGSSKSHKNEVESNTNDIYIVNLDGYEFDKADKIDKTCEQNHFVNNEDESNDALSHKISSARKVKKATGKPCLHFLKVVVNVFCVICSYLFIKNAYENWQSSPVVQALSNNQVHLGNIPFPAVTICWPTSFQKGYNFTHYLSKCLDCEQHGCINQKTMCNSEEMLMLGLAYEMCSEFESPHESILYGNIPRAIDGSIFVRYMEMLEPPCESDLLTIHFYEKSNSIYTRCNSELFQQFYADFSYDLCITYNGLRHEDIFRENVVPSINVSRQSNRNVPDSSLKWSYDTMMEFEGGMRTIPIYGLKALYMKMQRQGENNYIICKRNEKDVVSVMVHSPNEIPLEFDIDYVVHENSLLDMLVEPKITLAQESLAQYTPHQRGCFFAHENKLELFKYYTQKNCQLECLANAYLSKCGCVPFNFPRHNDTVKVCLWPSTRPDYHCECLPDCNNLSYDITFHGVPEDVKNEDTPYGAVWVEIKDYTFYTTVRYSISSYVEFLAYSLGILGAFLGLSVTCLWQAVYLGAVRVLRMAHPGVLPYHQ